MLAISLSAAWQLTYGPYVADYSGYLPRSTLVRSTFLGTFLGSVIGSQWSMTILTTSTAFTRTDRVSQGCVRRASVCSSWSRS